jgi:hypothetical protein
VNTIDTTGAVADATRAALDELGDLPNSSQLRAVIVLFDVATHHDNGEATQIIWKASPPISHAWAHGMLATAAHLARSGYQDLNQ